MDRDSAVPDREISGIDGEHLTGLTIKTLFHKWTALMTVLVCFAVLPRNRKYNVLTSGGFVYKRESIPRFACPAQMTENPPDMSFDIP